MNEATSIQIPEPNFSKFVFSDTRFSWFWLIVRWYVGYQWLMAGWGKVTNPAWFGPQAGSAIQGFLKGAAAKAVGEHPAVSDWYAYFINNVALPHPVFFSYLISCGEVAVGIGLIFGAFTGIAAFFGIIMNFNFLFAGTTSTNPTLLLMEIFLILAWRNSGWWGLDRWLLPRIGVPWQRGSALQAKELKS